jgi:glutaredoxin
MHLKRIFYGIAATTLLMLWQIAAAAVEEVNFFYGDGCPHCAVVKPFIAEMEAKYTDIKFNQYEVYNDMENAILIQEMFEKYNVPVNRRGVPALFLNGTYFIGDRPIMDNLENELIKLGKSEVTEYTNGEETISPATQPEPVEKEPIQQTKTEKSEASTAESAQPETQSQQPVVAEPDHSAFFILPLLVIVPLVYFAGRRKM